MSIAAASTIVPQDQPSVKRLMRRKSGTYEMLVTLISANHYTVTSSSLALVAYDVIRSEAGAPWLCDCEARVQRCRHVAAVEAHIGAPAEPTPAPATSGSVMDVLRRRRAANEAARVEHGSEQAQEMLRRCAVARAEAEAATVQTAIPFRRPVPPPRCVECGKPADPRYTHPDRCSFHGFKESFS